ncbi:SDR family NAD(P)-dependent oxidoreductase [Anaeromyxobacter dehalogenans]|uniref:Short-chain dehydrogenase/reductase SDR n=1 Tax=Anaeromyxobacter dehalogenans (strain 2CP-C) TaxID=290397 RepID=Q2IK95_ANADE|nr:SDR family oxidoreductase [Anaeromyxobacter dehalogenans]ABC82076.1 short-chain dehydrogenase/reductase SDR [Anaeromyxobacter dehalogenans 2CP-C]
MKAWKGKRVLITGAAAGIGRALAERLGARGAALILTDRDEEPLAATADAIRRAGAVAEHHVLDVTKGAAILQVRDAIHSRGGPIDVLVNNAGVVFGGAFADVPLQKHLDTFAVNVLGLVSVTHAFLDDLVARPEAHLVNVASAAGLTAVPFASTYAASKWAVVGFSESIRLELARQGHRQVHVTTVCPLYVSTGLFEGARPPLFTSMLTPAQLADEIVEGVEQDRVFVRTPWLVKLVPFLNGVLPTGLADVLSTALGAAGSMEQWTGRAAKVPEAPARRVAGRRRR